MKLLSPNLIALLGLLLCLQPWAASAQDGGEFPGMPVDSKLLRVQNQAEEVFERTDYKRAFFIYRNELAPIGDKYAQYMVGFMYLTGKGVEEDRAAASAWYRLAAERGTKEFVGVRDGLLKILDDEQRVRSDQLFVELRKQYSDLVLILRALRKDQRVLRSHTGSRVSASSSPLTVVGAGGELRSPDYYDQIERRMQARLDYIARRARVEIEDLNPGQVNLDSVEEQVNGYLVRLD